MNHRWLWGSRQHTLFYTHTRTYNTHNIKSAMWHPWCASAGLRHPKWRQTITNHYVRLAVTILSQELYFERHILYCNHQWIVSGEAGRLGSLLVVSSSCRKTTLNPYQYVPNPPEFWQNLQFKHSTLVSLAYFMQNRELINEIVDIDNYNIWLKLYCCIEITCSLSNYTLIKGYTPWWK